MALVCALAIWLATPIAAQADDYYVRPDGNNANSGEGDTPTMAWLTIQHAVDSVAPGDTIHIADGTYLAGATISTSSISLLGSSGSVLQTPSTALLVQSTDVRLVGLTLDGQSADPSSPGVQISPGVDQLAIEQCRIVQWGDSGLCFAGAISDLRLVDCLIQANGSDGIAFATTPSGLCTIEGNALRDNAGVGIRCEDLSPSANVRAVGNAWGHHDGPMAGDGVGPNIDFDPWVYGSYAAALSAPYVRETENITASVQITSSNLYGAMFSAQIPTSLVQVKQEPVIGTFATASEGAQFSTNSAASINSEGYLYFRGNRVRPDEAYSAVDSQLVVLSLTAQEIDGPSLCAPIAFVSSETKMAALGGVSIPLATLASTDVLVLGTTTVTGTVDLQGRGDESGAVASISTGLLYGWAASPNTTDPLGDYAFTDLTDDQYTVSIEMARYLDASAVITVTGDLQELPPVELLAGDANDSDFIDISDMSIIGGQYGFDGPDITDQRADINADGLVDIVDLVLAGGNYWLATSPWTT